MLFYTVKHGLSTCCCCLSSINRLAETCLAITDAFQAACDAPFSFIKQLLVIAADWCQILPTGVSCACRWVENEGGSSESAVCSAHPAAAG